MKTLRPILATFVCAVAALAAHARRHESPDALAYRRFHRAQRQKAVVEFLLRHDNQPPNLQSRLDKLVAGSCDHVRRYVTSALTISPSDVRHLGFVAEAIQDVGERHTVLMTLNHDTLLETCLQERKIGFIDGFSKIPNSVKVRTWQPLGLTRIGGHLGGGARVHL